MVKLVENTEETVHAKKLLDQLRSEVREALSGFEQIGDDELYDCIEQAVAGVAERQYLPLGQRIDLKNRLFDSFRRLDILQELVDDPEDGDYGKRKGSYFRGTKRQAGALESQL